MNLSFTLKKPQPLRYPENPLSLRGAHAHVALLTVAFFTLLALCILLSTSTQVHAHPPSPSSPKAPTSYTLERIDITDNTRTRPALIRRLSGLQPGQRVAIDQLGVVQTRLLGTGWFNDVKAHLEKGSKRGFVILKIEVKERNTVLLNDIILGSSKRHPFWGGLDVIDNHFLGSGLQLGGAFVAGDGQSGGRVRLVNPFASGLPVRFSGELRALQAREGIFFTDPRRRLRTPLTDPELIYTRTGGEVGTGIYPIPLLGVFVDLGLDVMRTDSPIPQETDAWLPKGRTTHPYLRLTFDHDTRDNPLVPTSGYRLNLSLQTSGEPVAGDFSYLRILLRSSYHRRVGPPSLGHVLRLDIFGGTIFGDAPIFERFFIGDVSSLIPSRNLDMNYSTRSSPDWLGRAADTLSYETVLAGAGVEYAVPLIEGPQPLYRLEFFFGFGLFGMTSLDDPPNERPLSLGLDTQPASTSNAFPMDLTFDIGFRAETPVGIFGLSFANGLALVPL